jgi:DnaK suppressor protein
MSVVTEKPASKAKQKLPVTAPEPPQEIVSMKTTKSDNNVPTNVEPVAESIIASAAPVTSQGLKWQEIRQILEKLKDDTIREIRKSVKNGTEAVAAIEPGGDIYDQASSERDRELGLLLGDREREKIHSIDEALLRINEGDYGICEECDEDIPLGRLKAMPFTRHCVKCKSELEKLQAQTKRVEEERAYREIPLGTEEEES